MGLTFKTRLTQNPKTLEENLHNVVKFGVNRSKDNFFLVIFFITMMMAFFHGYGINSWLSNKYPLMTKDELFNYAFVVVAVVHVFLIALKPPSLIGKYRARYVCWMASSYVSFFILGWLPVLRLYGIH
jgi:magnesium-transporting ATPase (P-type)